MTNRRPNPKSKTYKQLYKDSIDDISFLRNELSCLQRNNIHEKRDIESIVNILTQLIEDAVKRRLSSNCSSFPSSEETLLKECRDRIGSLK